MSVRSAARAALVLTGMLWGCDAPTPGPEAHPVPVLLAVDPEVAIRSSADTQVEFLGLGFVEASDARWNGESRPTTFVSSGRVRVTLTPEDLQAPAGEVDVVNPDPGGGTSDVLTLTVGNPAPRITGMSPTQAPAVVTERVLLTITGEEFVGGGAGSRVLWNGIPLTTTFVAATELTAVVPDYLLRTGDSVSVTVLNPAPGGGESGPAWFGVDNPVPVVVGTDPEGVPIRTDALIRVLGSGFTYGSRVWVDDWLLQPVGVSESVLSIQVPGHLALGGVTLSLRVENPPPGGGTSEAVMLDVWELPPRIEYLSPSHVFVGSPTFTLTIVGEDFDPDVEVRVDGELRPASFIGADRLQTQILSSDVDTEGEVEIRLTNPGAGSVGLAVLTVLPQSDLAGRVVAERWGATQLTVSDLDGGSPLTVRPGTGAARVDASPLGFQAVYHGFERIYEFDFPSQTPRRLTVGTAAAALAFEAWPRYSADGAWVYFNGVPAGGSSEVWRVRTDGTAAEQVVSSPGEWVGYPAPSHGGERVVYATGGEGGGPLYIYDLAAGVSTALGVSGVTSRWSPDDQWIVYLTPSYRLRAIRPDGTGDFGLVNGFDAGFGFDFSPDGTAIVSTTQGGDGFVVSFPEGLVEYLPGLGQVASIAYFGP